MVTRFFFSPPQSGQVSAVDAELLLLVCPWYVVTPQVCLWSSSSTDSQIVKSDGRSPTFSEPDRQPDQEEEKGEP